MIAFDLDGTLLDSMPYLEELAVHHITANYPLSETSARKLYRDTSGLPFRQQLEVSHLRYHASNPEVARRFERDKEKYYPGMALFPDVQGVLASLEHLGHSMAIVSNTREKLVREVANRFQLPVMTLGYNGRERFDKVAQLKHLRWMEDSLVFVGDSTRDVAFALQGGARFIGVLRPRSTASFSVGTKLIDNLYDLEKYV